MKLTINWAELGRQLWQAVKPVLLGAIGIPGIAIITSTSQSATYDGGDTNTASQANPANVTVPVTLGK